jgi:hypothetical protein
MAINGAKKTHIFCYSIDEKKEVMKKLKEKQFVFHSFAEPEDKKKVFVLKGYFYDSDPSSILKNFQDAGIQCSKITFLSKNEDYPIYLVHFDDSKINITLLQRQHHIINGLIVNWKPKTNSKSRPTQCFNCQLYGHAATNCSRPYRCVKCVEQHLPGQCQRTTREGNAKCVNCNGDHPANSVECSQYLKYCDVISKRSTTQTPTKLQQSYASTVRQSQQQQSAQSRLVAAATMPDINNNKNFPHLSQQNSANLVASQVSESSSNNSPSLISELNSLVHEFSNIPNIRETLNKFRTIIDQLKKTKIDDHQEKITILFSHAFDFALIGMPNPSMTQLNDEIS